jgi:hypothetical protein
VLNSWMSWAFQRLIGGFEIVIRVALQSWFMQVFLRSWYGNASSLRMSEVIGLA